MEVLVINLFALILVVMISLFAPFHFAVAGFHPIPDGFYKMAQRLYIEGYTTSKSKDSPPQKDGFIRKNLEDEDVALAGRALSKFFPHQGVATFDVLGVVRILQPHTGDKKDIVVIFGNNEALDLGFILLQELHSEAPLAFATGSKLAIAYLPETKNVDPEHQIPVMYFLAQNPDSDQPNLHVIVIEFSCDGKTTIFLRAGNTGAVFDEFHNGVSIWPEMAKLSRIDYDERDIFSSPVPGYERHKKGFTNMWQRVFTHDETEAMIRRDEESVQGRQCGDLLNNERRIEK